VQGTALRVQGTGDRAADGSVYSTETMTDQPFLGVPVRVQHLPGLTIAENAYTPFTDLPRHIHDRSFFSLTLAGEFEERHAQKAFTYGVSSVSFHPAGEEHSVHIGARAVRCLNVELDGRWTERLREVGAGDARLIRSDQGPLLWLATRLYDELRAWTPASPLAVEGLILEMLAAVASSWQPVERLQPRWVAHLEEILRSEYTESLSVVELAERIGVHPVHLSRMWRRFRGCSIGQYVHRIRVDNACRRIADGDVSLANLALEVGFADQTHFSRVFKQLTGMTPGGFRATVGRA
jgi:AraC family transcriptional regulator